MNAPKTHICIDCGREKILKRFKKDPKARDGYSNLCQLCANRRSVKWQQENPDKVRDIQARYRASHQQQCKAAQEKWELEHREERLEYHRDYNASHKDEIKKWRRANYQTPKGREAIARHARQRAARRRTVANNFASVSQQQLDDKWSYWEGRCWVCGELADAWDHVKPLTRGGWDIVANLRPACDSCNGRKNSHWPLPSRAWMAGIPEVPADIWWLTGLVK